MKGGRIRGCSVHNWKKDDIIVKKVLILPSSVEGLPWGE